MCRGGGRGAESEKSKRRKIKRMRVECSPPACVSFNLTPLCRHKKRKDNKLSPLVRGREGEKEKEKAREGESRQETESMQQRKAARKAESKIGGERQRKTEKGKAGTLLSASSSSADDVVLLSYQPHSRCAFNLPSRHTCPSRDRLSGDFMLAAFDFRCETFAL